MFHFWVLVTWTLGKLTCFSKQVFLLWYCTNNTLLYHQTDWITEQLEHVLEKKLWISIRDYRGTTTGVERKWRQVYVKSFEKKYYILPLQCEIQTIHEKNFFDGGDMYCLLTCYFVNLPHMRNSGFISLYFCRKPVFRESMTS